MNIREGKVISIDHASATGVIRDGKGREFLFFQNSCKDETIPALHERVTFIKDTDFKSTDVADLVMSASYTRAS